MQREAGSSTPFRSAAKNIGHATFPRVPGYLGMKTFLKVLLIAVLALAVLKLCPLFAVPVALALAALFIVTLVLAGGASVAILVILGLAVALLGVALALVTALAPIWLPVLAVVGLIALVRRATRKTA